jgi:protein-S-isoprenylcysteine O-methyltransferase Ste14
MPASYLWQFLYWAWVGSEIVILIATRTRRGGGEVLDRGSLLVLWPTIIASLTAGIWYGEVHPHTILGGAHWLPVLSLMILVAGLAIRWTAIATLGKSFSANVAIRSDQTVHKHGLFRFVRHPSYTGLLMIFLAAGLHTQSWVGLAIILLPPAFALLYRIHVEEQALGSAFGSEYADYSRTTKRLIPGIY